MEENKNIVNVSQGVTLALIQDLRLIIEQARGHVAATANYELTTMYWKLGERINREVLGNQRAEYGKQIVATASRQLQIEYGEKGFDEKNIRRMMQFASLFPDFQIVATLSRQLWWSHFVEVIPLKDELQREFYLTLAASEHWSIRQLRKEMMVCYTSALPLVESPICLLGKNSPLFAMTIRLLPTSYSRVRISWNSQA